MNLNNKKPEPSIDEILSLETIARAKGSGVNLEVANGKWRLLKVFKGSQDSLDNKLSNQFLIAISAQLEIYTISNNTELDSCKIINSVTLGILKIKFQGKGCFKGNQPILSFYFDQFKIDLGGLQIVSISLDIPEQSKRPFFSFIAISQKDKWISARGRGGGVALWSKD